MGGRVKHQFGALISCVLAGREAVVPCVFARRRTEVTPHHCFLIQEARSPTPTCGPQVRGTTGSTLRRCEPLVVRCELLAQKKICAHSWRIKIRHNAISASIGSRHL